jgi:hypothetical protein
MSLSLLRPPRRLSRRAALLALGLLYLGWLLAGCDLPAFTDRPVDEPAPPPAPAVVVAGPLVSASAPRRLTVCYITDRPAHGGARLSGAGQKLVRRTSLPRRYHALDFERLRPGTEYRCDLLIPEAEETPSRRVRTLPGPGQPARLAVVVGDPADPERTAAAFELLARRDPDAVILAGRHVDGADDPEAWTAFFAAHDAALGGPVLLHAPDRGAAGPGAMHRFFPGGAGGSYTLRAGDLTLLLLAAEELRPANAFRLEHWLEQSLARAETAWTAVLLPRNPVLPGPGGVKTALLHRFGALLEKGGARAAISPEAPYYHRSLPLGTGDRAVQYVSLPGARAAPPPASPSHYTAALGAGARVLFLDVSPESLRGRAEPVGEGPADAFVLGEADGPAAAIDRERFVTTAWARDSQRREVRALARQAARAVPNPARPGSLPFLVTNPSPLPFAGTMSWELRESAFLVEPLAVDFELEPGEALESFFRFTPGGGGQKLPVFRVQARSGPAAAAPLVLTWLRRLAVPRLDRDLTADGHVQEKLWNEAVEVGAFSRVDGEEAPEGAVRAWVAANADGLCVRFRCPATEAEVPPPGVRTHDGPVWKDESVEVFLDPGATGREFLEFAINTAGTVLEASSGQGLAFAPAWQAGVEQRDAYYSAEILIPWQAAGLSGPPPAGAEWGLNLTRNDYTGETPQVYQAAPTYGSNARSGCYLRIVFP